MLSNYIKIALRNILHNKLFSFINIFGLAVGLASCLMIFLWVQDELSYDRFHENSDRIFRVERKFDFKDKHGQAPITSGPYGPAMVKDYPEVDDYMRLGRIETVIKDHQQVSRKQRIFFADNSLFKIFNFKLEKGDPAAALTQPKTVVLTRDMAEKLMGTEDALGRTLSVEWGGEFTDFLITGILAEVPHNSHVHFDIVFSAFTYSEATLNIWFNNFLYTYVLLKEGTDPATLEAKMPAFLSRYMAEDFLAIIGPDVDINEVFQLKMKPLLSIHLYPSAEFEIEALGSITSVYIFSAIALMILIIACFNFMNLSTARANKRAREVGLRKTLGAFKHQLWRQFLAESVVLAFLALILALLLFMLFVPVFNIIANKSLSLGMLLPIQNLAAVLGITLFTGLAAGLYPAFYLTAFDPVKVLKGGIYKGKGRSSLRAGMAVFQFVISIVLIIGTLIIYRQMEYIQNKSLGFDKENMVLIPVESSNVSKNIKPFQDLLVKHTTVRSVAFSSNVPGSPAFSDTVFKRENSDDAFDLLFISTGYEFIDTYGFKLIKGRQFSREYGADLQGAAVLNLAAVGELGLTLDNVLDKKLYKYYDINKFQELTIVGIVDNFHYKSLHQIIEPCVLLLAPDELRYVSIRTNPGDLKMTLGFIRQTWEELYPGELFEFSFLDDRIALLYSGEGKIQNIFLIFSILSIFVACLGFFGLAAFSAQEKTKEIGVRKVLGASTTNIFLLLSKEFARWVLLANIIAWPAAYFAMSQWLQNFAYQKNMGLAPFFVAAVLALFIAMLTVSFQVLKAAWAEPVDSLKYE